MAIAGHLVEGSLNGLQHGPMNSFNLLVGVLVFLPEITGFEGTGIKWIEITLNQLLERSHKRLPMVQEA